jgi:hypothetical protein
MQEADEELEQLLHARVLACLTAGSMTFVRALAYSF